MHDATCRLIPIGITHIMNSFELIHTRSFFLVPLDWHHQGGRAGQNCCSGLLRAELMARHINMTFHPPEIEACTCAKIKYAFMPT